MTEDKLLELCRDIAGELKDEDYHSRCPICEGTGLSGEDGFECPDCDGAGWIEI
jgi:hypothetical protein